MFWMLKHNSVMVMCIATAFAVAIVIMLFCICRTFTNQQVCDVSNSSESLMTRLRMSRGLIKFSLQELMNATNNFGEGNLIGSGRFGPLYDGRIWNTCVAVKKLSGPLRPRFLDEVTYLSKIRHLNVVNVLGYCYNNGQQMIVYENLFNLRNVRVVDLKFKRRMSIALGAAKGLEHLHSLTPPLTHNTFKTGKILLDYHLNAKVPNAGLSQLIATEHDLEAGVVDQESFDETKDVRNFGLFLLELITGKEPVELLPLASNEEMIEWMAPLICGNALVDNKMNGTYTREELMIVAEIMLKCLKFPAKTRPKMKEVVTELEKIDPEEEDLSDDEGPYSNIITLGSELFAV